MPEQEFKRNIAYKVKIGDILSGKLVSEAERLKHIEIADIPVVRVNLIANITDKFVQEGEKKFASITLDDATGQIKAKLFGDDVKKFETVAQGDTLLIIGLLRSWNNETYITPEILKKKDPAFLLVRKLEVEKNKPAVVDKVEQMQLRDKILQTTKQNEDRGGVDIEALILELKATPGLINQEIRKLLEEGLVYEPRPGKLRYLG